MLKKGEHIKDFLRRELEAKFRENQISAYKSKSGLFNSIKTKKEYQQIDQNSKYNGNTDRKTAKGNTTAQELKEMKVCDVSEEKIACINLAYANG